MTKKWSLNIDLSEREMDILLLALHDFGGAGYERNEVVTVEKIVVRERAIHPEWRGNKRGA